MHAIFLGPRHRPLRRTLNLVTEHLRCPEQHLEFVQNRVADRLKLFACTSHLVNSGNPRGLKSQPLWCDPQAASRLVGGALGLYIGCAGPTFVAEWLTWDELWFRWRLVWLRSSSSCAGKSPICRAVPTYVRVARVYVNSGVSELAQDTRSPLKTARIAGKRHDLRQSWRGWHTVTWLPLGFRSGLRRWLSPGFVGCEVASPHPDAGCAGCPAASRAGSAAARWAGSDRPWLQGFVLDVGERAG